MKHIQTLRHITLEMAMLCRSSYDRLLQNFFKIFYIIHVQLSYDYSLDILKKPTVLQRTKI